MLCGGRVTVFGKESQKNLSRSQTRCWNMYSSICNEIVKPVANQSTNKTSNIRITQHRGQFTQPLLPRKSIKSCISRVCVPEVVMKFFPVGHLQ